MRRPSEPSNKDKNGNLSFLTGKGPAVTKTPLFELFSDEVGGAGRQKDAGPIEDNSSSAEEGQWTCGTEAVSPADGVLVVKGNQSEASRAERLINLLPNNRLSSAPSLSGEDKETQ